MFNKINKKYFSILMLLNYYMNKYIYQYRYWFYFFSQCKNFNI